jgi:hypothetical protein
MVKKSRGDYKQQLRQQARRTVGTQKHDLTSQSQYRTDVDKGLAELRRVSAEGGDGKAQRVKNELNYLLNNYLPSYDMRIEQLIDEWRRSGDPSYDPAIRARLRRARQEHMSRSNPF